MNDFDKLLEVMVEQSYEIMIGSIDGEGTPVKGWINESDLDSLFEENWSYEKWPVDSKYTVKESNSNPNFTEVLIGLK